jgi:hypothetical protein
LEGLGYKLFPKILDLDENVFQEEVLQLFLTESMTKKKSFMTLRKGADAIKSFL